MTSRLDLDEIAFTGSTRIGNPFVTVASLNIEDHHA